MNSNKRKFEENKESIKEMLNKGINYKIISKNFDIQYHSLRGYSKKNNIKKGGYILSDENISEITFYYLLGASLPKILQKMTDKEETIYIQEISNFYKSIKEKRKNKSHLDIDTILEIKELSKKGYGINQISNDLRIRKNSVRNVIKINNLKIKGKYKLIKSISNINDLKRSNKNEIEMYKNIISDFPNYEVFKLSGYGADFLLSNEKNIIIECKTTLSSFSFSNALLQMMYCKKMLEKDKKINEMVIYSMRENSDFKIPTYSKFFMDENNIKIKIIKEV